LENRERERREPATLDLGFTARKNHISETAYHSSGWYTTFRVETSSYIYNFLNPVDVEISLT
jgi:hypothetical protein